MAFLISGNLDGIGYIIYTILLGPPLLFLVLGINRYKKDKQRAKIYFAIAGTYLVIGLGMCFG